MGSLISMIGETAFSIILLILAVLWILTPLAVFSINDNLKKNS